ncbi:MAG: flagellar basal body-associated FliL family protein [Sarcina sp.]
MAKKKKKDEGNSSKKNLKSIIIGGIILLIVFIGSFIFFSYVMKNKNTEANPKEVIVKEQLSNLSLGDEFVVNLADQEKRYIKANIVVAYDKNDKEFAKTSEESVVKLRDAVINTLKLITVEETKDTENLKKKLIENLNSAINQENTIKDVYFQSLIVQ